jgi:hypothetical protein
MFRGIKRAPNLKVFARLFKKFLSLKRFLKFSNPTKATLRPLKLTKERLLRIVLPKGR